MCDYSQGGIRTRAAETGDKLVISRWTHGFMASADAKRFDGNAYNALCLTCIKEVGTVLNITLPDGFSSGRHNGLIPGMTYKDVEYVKLSGETYRDGLRVSSFTTPVVIAYLPPGTTATVVSIPSVVAAAKAAKAAKARKAKAVAAKRKKQSLEVRLGLDKLNAKITKGNEPAKVRAAYKKAAKKTPALARSR